MVGKRLMQERMRRDKMARRHRRDLTFLVLGGFLAALGVYLWLK